MDTPIERKCDTGFENRMLLYYQALQRMARTGDVDREMTSDLVTAAKGTRSMRKFAEEMDVNASSISRIVNGQVGEVSDTLLAKIACHADPDSGVTIEKLMEAQGLVERQKLGSRYEESCRRIMADELLKRGYAVSYNAANPYEFYDFEIVTDAIPGERWLVEAKMTSAGSPFPAGSGRLGQWLDKAMSYFYCGGKAGRISLIVDHEAVFEQLKGRMVGLAIPDEISVILVSTREGKILEEYVAPLADGRVPPQVFGNRE